MNWISLCFSGVIAALTIGQILSDHLSKHVFGDGRTKKHKWLRTLALSLTLALVVANLIFSGISDAKKDQKATKLQQTIDSLKGTISSLTNEINSVNSNQLSLSKQNQSLLDLLANDNKIDSSTRLRILDSEKQFQIISSDVVDLNSWQLELQNKIASQKIKRDQERIAALETEKAKMQKCFPIFDYTIRKFQAMLAEVAKQNGDHVASSYHGFPEVLSNSQIVAEIKLDAKPNWYFVVHVRRIFPGTESIPPRLIIFAPPSMALSLEVRPHPDYQTFLANLAIPGQELMSSEMPITNFTETIDESLRNLIAAKAKQTTVTNQ